MLRVALFAVALLPVVAGCRSPHLARSAESIAACARGEDGVWCSRWTEQGFTDAALWTSDFGWGSAAAGDDTALLTPDLDGDGRSDVCLRRITGLGCALRTTADSFGATRYSDGFADADGFARWAAVPTIAFADVDGDGLVDVCARQPSALLCAHGRGDGTFAAPAPWLRVSFGDDAAECAPSMRLGDIDGDGADDVCVKCSDGVRCALARGDHFSSELLRTGAFADDGVSGHDGFFELVDIDGDRRRDVCGREGGEVRCMLFDGTRFSPGPVLGGIASGEVARFGDIDGDGRADVCLFDHHGAQCATARSGFASSAWDAGGLVGRPRQGAPVELIDVDGDGRADHCRVGADGMACGRSSGTRFAAGAATQPFQLARGSDATLDLTTALIGPRRAPDAGAINPIVVENERTGSDDWWIPYPQWSMAREVEAYVDRTSYRPGQRVEVMLSTAADGDAVHWRLLRTGWYGGRGARQLLDGDVYGHPQPAARLAPLTPVRAGWTSTFSITVPPDAVSGVYALRLDSKASAKSFFVTFVVRDDERPAPLLFERADYTDEAYNDWDGAANSSSAYRGTVYVSLDRPLRSVAALGIYSYSSGYFLYEYPMVRWLEAQGYDVAYVSDVDVHEGYDLTRATAFLSVGHDEYWSAAMRDNVERARDGGLNLAFFGSDAVDGLIRFKHGDPRSFSRTISDTNTHKNEFGDKPVDGKRPPHDNPSDTLTGTHYVAWCSAAHPECATGDPAAKLRVADDFHVTAPGHPIFRGVDTDAPLRQLVGYEYEAPLADSGSLPFDLQLLASTDGLHLDQQPVMVAYRAAGGARVVNIGSMYWAHALDPWAGDAAVRVAGGERPCSSGESDCFTRHDLAATRVTANILADLGLVPATPSPSLARIRRAPW